MSSIKIAGNPEALFKMINMYIALDGTPEAEPENGYVWSWCPTQFYDPYDINEQYVKINEQLEIDPKAEGEAPVSWDGAYEKALEGISGISCLEGRSFRDQVPGEYVRQHYDPASTKTARGRRSSIFTIRKRE